jgi:hypothetical protein
MCDDILIAVYLQYCATNILPIMHRLLPRPAAKWALDTPERAYKPTTPLQLLDAVTKAVAPTQPTQGCHNRHTLPGGRSCSQKLGLLCRCYLRQPPDHHLFISHMCIVI